MTQHDIETVLKYLMAKLPEHELEELDKVLTEGGARTPAMDAACGSAERRHWLGQTPQYRNAARSAKRSGTRRHLGLDAKPPSYAEQFPHADRLHR